MAIIWDSMKEPARKIPVVFYRTAAGVEVVRNWLRDLNDEDRNIVGQDLIPCSFAGRSECPCAGPWAMGFGKCGAG